jgi:zinc transport system substrate-binding protein
VRRILYLLATVFLVSCGPGGTDKQEKIITVSIAPYKYFVDAVSGGEYSVNIMVPAGANPHIYEPFPKQIALLRQSVAYISNGYLGFELTWLDRFYDTNRDMKKLDLSRGIEPIGSHHHDGEHTEGADPHYWVSPACARIMAVSVRDFLSGLNPSDSARYTANLRKLLTEIDTLDAIALKAFSGPGARSFMIYHPNLGYLARDYGLEEITVEYEGKEPPPSRLRELIDRAQADNIKTIFVQKEYDTKNARAIADEIGARIEIIDPLAANWHESTLSIIEALGRSLDEERKR